VALLTLLFALASPAVAAEVSPASPPMIPKNTPVTGEPDAGAVNLMNNPGFEDANEKKDGPAMWQGVDNLVYYWATDPDAPARGKVVKIDTDVDQKEAYRWWVKRFLHGASLSDAPKKTPNPVPGYGTIAGLDGGYYWSDYIEIKPGRAYKVYVDAKGPMSKVFIRGYEKKVPLSFGDEAPATQEMFREARGEPLVDAKGNPRKYRLRYQYQTWFHVGGGNGWATYTHQQARNPTGREMTEDVRYIRITLYPYWPQATYWYDNIRVYEVDPPRDKNKAEAEEADFEEGKVVK